MRWPGDAKAAKCPSCTHIIHREPSARPASSADRPNPKASSTSAASTRALRCPGCVQPIRVSLASAGQQVRCPHCNKVLRIPNGNPTDTAAKLPPQPAYPNQAASNTAGFTPTSFNAASFTPSGFHPTAHNPYAAPASGGFAAQPTRPPQSDWKLVGIVFGVSLVVGVIPILGALFFLLALVVGIIGGNIAALWLIVRTFQFDVAAGFLSIFVPFYQPYFAYKHYQEMRDPVLAVACTTLPLLACLIGLVIQMLFFMAVGAIQ